MTLQTLALLVAMAVTVQAAVFVGVALTRRRRREPAENIVELPASGSGQEIAPFWPGLRQFRVERRVMEDEAGTACSFHLVPVDGRPLPPFAPGQFLTFDLTVPDPHKEEPKHIVRCYSLSDRPDPTHYRITVKRIRADEKLPESRPGISSNHLHDHVAAGSILSVRAPSGHFRLQGTMADPIVLIGGGIGITPMLSMLAHSLATTPRREIWLFYGVRDGSEQVMKSQLAEAAGNHDSFHLHICYSRPRADDRIGIDYHHAGHVDLDLLRRTLPLKPFDFYICGPRQMMESLVPALAQWGVPEARIHYEAFGPASLARTPAKTATSVTQPLVTFAKSGCALRWTGAEASLLEFAEAQGIAVDSGCRAGGCGTCQTRVRSGEVSYDHAPDFDVEAGSCLLCIASPKTDLTLDA